MNQFKYCKYYSVDMSIPSLSVILTIAMAMLPSVKPHACALVGNCSNTLNCSSCSNISSSLMFIVNRNDVVESGIRNDRFVDK